MILSFDGIRPKIADSCFVAPHSVVVGNVEIGEGSSVWFNTVLRGDVNFIRIGKRTNIQDLCVVHVYNADSPQTAPTIIGDDVTVGHRVVLHGCTIKNKCLVGMGSVILDRAMVEEGSVVGAGSLVTVGTVIPAGHLAFGSPAKVIRPLNDEEKTMVAFSAAHYVELAAKYKSAKKAQND